MGTKVDNKVAAGENFSWGRIFLNLNCVGGYTIACGLRELNKLYIKMSERFPFLYFASWNVDMMFGALVAILEHEDKQHILGMTV